jgi:hypothetical protein
VEGSLTNEHGETMSAGAVMTARPNEMYGPLSAGPDGYVTIEIFSRLAGAYELTWDTLRGSLLDNRLTGSRRGAAQ